MKNLTRVIIALIILATMSTVMAYSTQPKQTKAHTQTQSPIQLYTPIPAIGHANSLKESQTIISNYYNSLCQQVQYIDDNHINSIFEMDMRGELTPPLTHSDIEWLQELHGFSQICKQQGGYYIELITPLTQQQIKEGYRMAEDGSIVPPGYYSN